MPTGRKPKPTFLRIIEGNPGHRPLNHDEPQPEGVLIDPPPTMSADQQLIWRTELAKAPEGMVRSLDIGVFTSYVIYFARMLEADRRVQELGLIVKAPVSGQPMQNPYVSISNQANAAMVKAASELGFSPSSRSRVKVTGRKKTQSAFGKLKEFKP